MESGNDTSAGPRNVRKGPRAIEAAGLVGIAHGGVGARALRSVERRHTAGGRSELDAGVGSTLAIACTVDADAIKIATQYRPMSAISQ